MKTKIIISILLFSFFAIINNIEISSPDGRLIVNLQVEKGVATYSLKYDNQEMIQPSRLGLKSNIGDFSEGLTLITQEISELQKSYDMSRTKASHSEFSANKLDCLLENGEKHKITFTFIVSNNDVAFRYTLHRQENDNPKSAVIFSEVSSFLFPEGTTTFISPQSDPMIGWERTKPSYEEVYSADEEMGKRSLYGRGYVFPALFHTGNHGWVLLGETGVTSGYVGSHLSDFSPEIGYTIAYPMEGENNGIGTTYAGIPIPGSTPWRTITVGANLKPIVETTITYDIVDPLYEPSIEYNPVIYTWSWLIWPDDSINCEDQVQFIYLAAAMGFEYCLVDNWWDARIGREKIEELSNYAQSKGVRLMLWYNSNGYENDAPQTPRQCMHNSIVREKEMKWMQSIGIAGIKVDFFGGDKQVTMQLYEDLLSDANRFGLQVIFHGCTLPRGWERLYPNYVASEAVLASENVFFNEGSALRQPFDLTLHPFCRNSLASMDWGGIIMNRFLSRDNASRHTRKTTDVFEMASGIIMQTSIQCVAMQPNNLDELPQVEIDFLKNLPSAWEETVFIDGYPGKFVILARKSAGKWYVSGLNGESNMKEMEVELPMFEPEKTVNYYTDDKNGYALLTEVRVDNSRKVTIVMQPNGGFIIN
ncbi:glycoside hydrolase family 97 protein [Methanosphaera sp.]|uniref:glycoside hydrolase family 97 protein n=1 Tax=Methanosphaera sp. TaxID=2666342 RepID=UPI0025E8B7A0|nr:glycoside hydrolase family 97 protein [Methanosphaera sp.]